LPKKEQAIVDIHKFYARQHIKKGISFDEFAEQEKIDAGEFNAFCKDFGLKIPKTKIISIFKKV